MSWTSSTLSNQKQLPPNGKLFIKTLKIVVNFFYRSCFIIIHLTKMHPKVTKLNTVNNLLQEQCTLYFPNHKALLHNGSAVDIWTPLPLPLPHMPPSSISPLLISPYHYTTFLTQETWIMENGHFLWPAYQQVYQVNLPRSPWLRNFCL